MPKLVPNLEYFSELYQLDTGNWVWLIFCALCIGMAKTGLTGIGLLIVPILASIFGAKESTGILLPMLVMGDIFGVAYYHRHAKMKHLIKLMPSTIVGILIGVVLGDLMNAAQFTNILAVVVIGSVILMIWQMRYASEKSIPHNWGFASLAGTTGGFTTMVGNAAGPVMSIYFLSMNLNKNNFIGTKAWFFLIVNVFKVPFHVVQWETIDGNSFSLNLLMFPVIMIGAWGGIKIVKLIPEKPYKIFVLISILLASLKLFF